MSRGGRHSGIDLSPILTRDRGILLQNILRVCDAVVDIKHKITVETETNIDTTISQYAILVMQFAVT